MQSRRTEHPCILVVDDDPTIRRLIVSTLGRAGYSLTEAGNGREALDAMRRGTEDLVLLDLMMPELTGWDVLRIRGETPALQQIPVIVITANHVPGLRETLGSGVCALLGKPFDLSELLSLVRSCLAWHPPAVSA